MTIEQVEIRRILNQMLADNGINRETIKDIIKECIDEKIDKAVKKFEYQSCGDFVDMERRIQSAIDRMVRDEVERQAKEAIRQKVGYIFGTIKVNIELNNPTESEDKE